MERDKRLRIDNQYYLKNRHVEIDFKKLSQFLLSTKEALDRLGTDKIAELRAKIKDF